MAASPNVSTTLKLGQMPGKKRVYNLGNGSGYSVREVIDTVSEVVGQELVYDIGGRRAGDPAVLVASSDKIRKELKDKYGFPIKLEFHTKHLLTNKNPYRSYKWSDQQRHDIIFDLFQLISELDIRIINVAIIKENIKKEDYNVLDKALTYNIQRIENDLSKLNKPDTNFLIITDEGRIGKMRKTSRKIQRFNLIPSKIYPGTVYQENIRLLIEDPLAKESDESYFLQIADLVSYITYLYSIKKFINREWANRVKNVLSMEDVILLLNTIKPRLNCKAALDNEFGIVNYPRR